MPLRARCSDCDKSYAVDDRHAGRRLKCKACGGTVEVPAVAGLVAAASRTAAPRPVGAAAAAAAPPASRSTATRPAQRSQPPAPPQSDDAFGNMDALLSLEAGRTLNQDLPALAPPPLPKPGRANAGPAAPAVPLSYARPTGPRRDPNWRPPGQDAGGGFGALFVTRILPIGGGVLALLFVLALAVDALKLPVILILGLGGMLMMFTGGIGCLICAFRESSICGLLYLFVPLYGIYYILSRLEDTKVYVLTWLGGIACIVGVAVLVPKDDRRNRAELPEANRPAVVLAQGAGAAI